jgi:hypothetical protein
MDLGIEIIEPRKFYSLFLWVTILLI